MKTIADLHMHTSVSQHAYRTLDEMAMAAKFKGFKAFGITNHGPGMLDGAMELHFLCLRNLPDELYGIRFYKGAEVNIKSYDGQLDLPESILKTWILSLLPITRRPLPRPHRRITRGGLSRS